MNTPEYEHYCNTFGGSPLSERDYARLVVTARAMLSAVCGRKEEEMPMDYRLDAAICHQVDLLARLGGVESLTGKAVRPIQQKVGEISLTWSSDGDGLPRLWGIPLAPAALLMLRELGLTCRYRGEGGEA